MDPLGDGWTVSCLNLAAVSHNSVVHKVRTILLVVYEPSYCNIP